MKFDQDIAAAESPAIWLYNDDDNMFIGAPCAQGGRLQLHP